MQIAIDGEGHPGPRCAVCIALFSRGERPLSDETDSEPGLRARVPAG